MRRFFLASTIFAISLAVSGCVDTVSVGSGRYIGPGYMSSGIIRGDQHVRVIQRGDNMYYNGHRGYRNQRAGYRNYKGYWYPGSAFVGTVTINGGYQQNSARYVGRSHANWCADRYRSYRMTDNSFNTGNGRRLCNSPFGQDR